MDSRWIAMLTPGRPIGGARRYRALHEFLASRGWGLDAASGDPCWIYLPAYGGAAIALDRAELDVPDLADLGPLRPTVYLGEADTTVIGHGTWNGCDRHRERRWRFTHRDLGGAWRLGAVIAEVERAAGVADPRPIQDCVVAGPCGEWLRRWRVDGGPWPGLRQ